MSNKILLAENDEISIIFKDIKLLEGGLSSECNAHALKYQGELVTLVETQIQNNAPRYNIEWGKAKKGDKKAQEKIKKFLTGEFNNDLTFKNNFNSLIKSIMDSLKDSFEKVLPEDIEKAFKSANLIETMISHELNLINHRMTWLTVSQSFLFTAFVALTTGNPTKPSRFYEICTATLKILIPSIGFFISLSVYIALWAAILVLDDLLLSRGKLYNGLNKSNFLSVYVPVLHNKKHTHRWGSYPPKIVPLILILGWTLVLIIIFLQLLNGDLDFINKFFNYAKLSNHK